MVEKEREEASIAPPIGSSTSTHSLLTWYQCHSNVWEKKKCVSPHKAIIRTSKSAVIETPPNSAIIGTPPKSAIIGTPSKSAVIETPNFAAIIGTPPKLVIGGTPPKS
ncbi:Hypothetical predicted protein, partial [Pelobates cultripes]